VRWAVVHVLRADRGVSRAVSSVPTASSATSSQVAAANPSAYALGNAAPAASRSSSTCCSSAPHAASISAPPSVRVIASTPAAIPALSAGSAAMAAADIGV
jgi:hypothetical protein